MSKRRGQTTVFIIVAILVVAGVVLFFSLKGNSSVNEEDNRKVSNLGVENIGPYVQKCLDDSSEEVVSELVFSGGHHFPPENSSISGIPYYMRNNITSIPSMSLIEEEISSGITTEMYICTAGIENISSDYSVSTGRISPNTNISEKEIYIRLKYPITLSKNGTTSKLEEFESSLKINLPKLHESASKIAKSSHENICFTCATRISNNNNLNTNITYYNGTAIFSVRDPEQKLNNQTLEWNFANEY